MSWDKESSFFVVVVVGVFEELKPKNPEEMHFIAGVRREFDASDAGWVL